MLSVKKISHLASKFFIPENKKLFSKKLLFQEICISIVSALVSHWELQWEVGVSEPPQLICEPPIQSSTRAEILRVPATWKFDRERELAESPVSRPLKQWLLYIMREYA